MPLGYTRPSVVTPGSDPREDDLTYSYTHTNLPILATTIFDAVSSSPGSMMQPCQWTPQTIDALYGECQPLPVHQFEAPSHDEKNSPSDVSTAMASIAEAVHDDTQTTTINTTFWPIDNMDDDVSDVSSLSSANMLFSTYNTTNEGDAA